MKMHQSIRTIAMMDTHYSKQPGDIEIPCLAAGILPFVLNGVYIHAQILTCLALPVFS